jgi:hypothetical protein
MCASSATSMYEARVGTYKYSVREYFSILVLGVL